jgi:hypothetical protein
MANSKTYLIGLPRTTRGQGVVEAIVALPVFLLLLAILIQLFLLAIAQVQLRYAAFCAARVGAVRNADIEEMNITVGKVLSATTGFNPTYSGSYKVEKLDPLIRQDNKNTNSYGGPPELIKIRVKWDFPLSVPLINGLLSGIFHNRFFNKIPSVSLQATWTTVMFEPAKEKSDERK